MQPALPPVVFQPLLVYFKLPPLKEDSQEPTDMPGAAGAKPADRELPRAGNNKNTLGM